MLQAPNRAAPRRRPLPGPPNFPTAVYQVHRPKPAPAPVRYTPPRQLRLAKQQRQTYHSQAGAVRRVAFTQPTLGPGEVARPKGPHGKVLRASDVRRVQRSKGYQGRQQVKQLASQAQSVEHVANAQRQVAGALAALHMRPSTTPKRKASDIYQADPRKLKQMGFALPSGTSKAIAGAIKATVPALKAANKEVGYAGKDLGDLAVNTVPSTIKLADTAIHNPLKVPGMLAAPYIHLYHHPGDALTHPFSTALMLSPAVKLPLLGAGRVARLAGKQSLIRDTATLPGTAAKELRINQREAIAGPITRARRARGRKTGRGGAVITIKDMQRRVDAHAEFARQHAHQAETQAAKRTYKASKHLPKAEREQLVATAREQARAQAKIESDQKLARDFGTNLRPAVPRAEVDAARAQIDAAELTKKEARKARKAANRAHATAYANARVARAKRNTSSTLKRLESQRSDAQRGLIAERNAGLVAERQLGKAHAGARVSTAKPKLSQQLLNLHAQRRTLVSRTVSHGVVLARAAVRDADRQVNALTREMQRSQEKASRLQGVSEGRFAAGRMTAGVGKRAADQADHVGVLTDALTSAQRVAARARDDLKAAESAHRGTIREQTRALNDQIRAEHRRIAGVAPAEHGKLLTAIERHGQTPARVARAREGVRQLDEQIRAERQRIAGIPPAEHDALVSAIHNKAQAEAAHRGAIENLTAAEQLHKDVRQAHRETALVDPAGAGRLFADKADAKRMAQRLNEQGHQVPVGGHVAGEAHVREPGTAPDQAGVVSKRVSRQKGTTGTKPLTFRIRKVGEDHYAVLPQVVKQRMYGGGGADAQLSHASVGTGKATGAKFMRSGRRLLTQATLPGSLKWLAGQTVEAGVRGLTAGAGPFDWVRFNRVVKRMNADKPGSGDAFALAVRGGHFDPTGALAEQLGQGKSFAEEYAGGPALVHRAAKTATSIGETAPAQLGRRGWRLYSHHVIGSINKLIENNTRTAMAGHAIKHGPLMERHAFGLMDRAIKDAADGLQGTEHQVHAAREVDDMYGRYSKWSPEMRSMLMHWTPFLPWYLNSAKFLFHTLPVKHPLKAALASDIDRATEDWRKLHHQSFHDANHAPDFMLGSYPLSGGRSLRISHYTPWGVGSNVAGAAADLALPQVLGPIKNLGGVDWKWQALNKGDKKKTPAGGWQRVERAIATELESQVPLISQAGALSGLTSHYVDRKKDVGTFGERASKLLPWTPTKPPVKKRKKTAGLGGGGLGGGGLGGGGLGGSGL